MQVRPGAPSAEADIAKHLAAVHLLSRGHGKARQVAVTGGDVVAVIENDQPPVTVGEIGVADYALGGCNHRIAVVSGDIDAAVESAFTVEGIHALAEGAGHPPLDRPHVRSIEH